MALHAARFAAPAQKIEQRSFAEFNEFADCCESAAWVSIRVTRVSRFVGPPVHYCWEVGCSGVRVVRKKEEGSSLG